MHKYFSWKQTRAYTDDEWCTLVIAWCKLHSKLEDLIRVSTKVKIEDKKNPIPHDFLLVSSDIKIAPDSLSYVTDDQIGFVSADGGVGFFSLAKDPKNAFINYTPDNIYRNFKIKTQYLFYTEVIYALFRLAETLIPGVLTKWKPGRLEPEIKAWVDELCLEVQAQ